MRTQIHALLYEAVSRVLLVLLRVPGLHRLLTWWSKVWLRQARIVAHLASGPYDAIIDGGASIGEFAALARLAAPRTPLLCVEPHPASAAVLRRRGFQTVEAALWHERSRITLRQPSQATTSCTVIGAPGAKESRAWDVECVRLDQLGVAGQRILIKLDLQGAEPQALQGMGELWDHCAALLLEVSHGEGGTYEPLRTLLAERGFTEAATFGELEAGGSVIESDKLWLRRRPRREDR